MTGLAAAMKRSLIADIGCGAYNSFAVAKSGVVVGWGLNNSGQLGLPREEKESCLQWEPVHIEALEGVSVRGYSAQQQCLHPGEGQEAGGERLGQCIGHWSACSPEGVNVRHGQCLARAGRQGGRDELICC